MTIALDHVIKNKIEYTKCFSVQTGTGRNEWRRKPPVLLGTYVLYYYISKGAYPRSHKVTSKYTWAFPWEIKLIKDYFHLNSNESKIECLVISKAYLKNFLNYLGSLVELENPICRNYIKLPNLNRKQY